MSSEPPDELKRKLPHDPRLWARNYLRHPNDPGRAYDFYDDTKQNFLYYLTDDDGPLNPTQWGDINVLLFARGCLKTWSTTTIAGWALDMYPSCEFVATAPVDDQRSEVIDRFKAKVKQSDLVDRRVKDNVGHQKFENVTVDEDTGERYPAYSHLKSRSAWSQGDKLRGLHAHGGIIDESQDVDEGTFSTFLEAIDREMPQVDYFPTIFVIGTPKMAHTFFHKLWKMSDQKTWDADEREWVSQADAQQFLPQELESRRDELEEKLQKTQEQLAGDLDDERRKRLERLADDFRAELDDIEGFTVRGWHIDQYNSPLHDQRDIAFKRETYSERKFKNEVEAKFYSPENDLITSNDVWEVAFTDEPFSPKPTHPDTVNVLAVDWGGGQGEGAASTVLVVGELEPDGETLRVNNVDILDSSLSSKEERERIDTWMQQYDVDVAVVDEGYGDTDRETLQDEYGYDDSGDQRLYGCWYGSVKEKEQVKWNRHNSSRRFFTASKVYMVESMAEDFKDGNVVIPKEDLSFDSKRSDGTMVVDQLTAPYTERKETESGKKKKVIKSDRNDDIFDALTLLWVAAFKVHSRRTVKDIGTHSRKGY